MNPQKRPVVGVTLDAENPGGYSKFPWYAVRANYADAIAAAGGLPLALPHQSGSGGGVSGPHRRPGGDRRRVRCGPGAVRRRRPPRVCGAEARPHGGEMALLRGALARGSRVLGICGGEQLLAVALGGSLVQHIPDSVPHALAHEQPNPRDQPGHAVRVASGSLLHRIVGADTMQVNSSHHQAVRAPGPHAVVNAVAPDGVIEGLEDPRQRFCLGVQWHPEFLIDPGDARIFAAMIAACAA